MNFFAIPDRQAYMESCNVIYKAKEFFQLYQLTVYENLDWNEFIPV